MKIKLSIRFEKEYKKLSKKFNNLHKDYKSLLFSLLEKPRQGESLGDNCYKIRLKNSDINKVKSGGYRVITYVIKNNFIYLLTIYSKSDKDNILKDEIVEIIKTLNGVNSSE